ncbi:hypothetical protein TNCV_4719961 [Trichonephila clavipes]|uniref:Uncharacterized protein n=1 Tax=Trichonephila clavipes TaxID=2585209 RepID=A0A8X7BFP2_TRICX|nr:hypothetical protein TNCV_4719961 [Trichonephila clavipes]
MRSLLEEVETDQVREEPDEIMDIHHDSKSKFQKSDEHETLELKGTISIKGNMKPKVYYTPLSQSSKDLKK